MQDITNTQIDSLSVVVSVNERGENLLDVLKAYQASLSQLEIKIEYIVVLTPQYAHFLNPLKEINSEQNSIKIVVLNRNYGEAGEIKIGVEHSEYDHILTLPPYEQIKASNLPQILSAMDDNDVVIVNRWPRIDPISNKIQSILFKAIFKMLAFNGPKDPGSGIRLVRKEVFDDIKLYGDMHRFFKILAENSGFKTNSIDIPQSKTDAYTRVYGLKTYLTRFLDILTIVFLSRFNKKPLRFFGAGGAISAFIGVLGLSFVAIQKIFYDIPAGDRPILILFSLFLVLGVQLIAIGLVGETIIFTSSKNNKEYRIKKIVN